MGSNRVLYAHEKDMAAIERDIRADRNESRVLNKPAMVQYLKEFPRMPFKDARKLLVDTYGNIPMVDSALAEVYATALAEV